MLERADTPEARRAIEGLSSDVDTFKDRIWKEVPAAFAQLRVQCAAPGEEPDETEEDLEKQTWLAMIAFAALKPAKTGLGVRWTAAQGFGAQAKGGAKWTKCKLDDYVKALVYDKRDDHGTEFGALVLAAREDNTYSRHEAAHDAIYKALKGERWLQQAVGVISIKGGMDVPLFDTLMQAGKRAEPAEARISTGLLDKQEPEESSESEKEDAKDADYKPDAAPELPAKRGKRSKDTSSDSEEEAPILKRPKPLPSADPLPTPRHNDSDTDSDSAEEEAPDRPECTLLALLQDHARKTREEHVRHFADRILPRKSDRLGLNPTAAKPAKPTLVQHQFAVDFVRRVHAARGLLPPPGSSQDLLDLQAKALGVHAAVAAFARDPGNLSDGLTLREDQLKTVAEAASLALEGPTMGKVVLSGDMGAGKTKMAVAAIAALRGANLHPARKCLVVAPPGVVDQWEREISAFHCAEVTAVRHVGELFDASLRAAYASTRTGKTTFLVVHYNCLSRDEHVRILYDFAYASTLIFDEFHTNLRDPQGQHGASAALLCRYTQAHEMLGLPRKVALFLSGTPIIGTNASEARHLLWSLFGVRDLPADADKEAVAQNILRAMSVKYEVPFRLPQVPVYVVYTPAPEVDADASGAARCRSNRHGNHVPTLQYPPAAYALFAALWLARHRGLRTLVFYDTRRGVEETEEIVQGMGDNWISYACYLHGGKSDEQQRKEKQFIKDLPPDQGCIVVMTNAMGREGHNDFADAGFTQVFIVGETNYSVLDVMQAVGRVRRYPCNERATLLAVSFVSVDADSAKVSELTARKQRRAGHANASRVVRTDRARGQVDPADYEDLLPFVEGVRALARHWPGELRRAVNWKSGKFALSAYTQLTTIAQADSRQNFLKQLRNVLDRDLKSAKESDTAEVIEAEPEREASPTPDQLQPPPPPPSAPPAKVPKDPYGGLGAAEVERRMAGMTAQEVADMVSRGSKRDPPLTDRQKELFLQYESHDLRQAEATKAAVRLVLEAAKDKAAEMPVDIVRRSPTPPTPPVAEEPPDESSSSDEVENPIFNCLSKMENMMKK